MSKAKTSFKGILFLLLIVVIIGGVVATIVFWPKNPDGVKEDLNNQTSTHLNTDGELLTNLRNYGEYAVDYRASSEVVDNGYVSVYKVYSALSIYFDFMAYTFENADFSQCELNDISNAQSGLNDATNEIKAISTFLKEKNDSLTADGYNTKVYQVTDAKLVWENIKIDIKESFEDYYKATANLAKVYARNIKTGVYANDFARVTVEGVSYYLNYFQKEFNNLGSKSYKTMTDDFANFVTTYLAKGETSQRMVASYLTSPSIQENTSVLVKFSELFKDYLLETLLLDGISYDAKLFTAEQTGYLVVGVKFFKGELAK